MFILNWYVTKNFLATFTMSIVVLTFAMTGANLMRVIEYISQGLSPLIAGKFLLLALPMALAFAIPWASLVSIMLVFGRMSADNEITAMRACGISILQIISPIIVSSFLLTCVCLWLQLQPVFFTAVATAEPTEPTPIIAIFMFFLLYSLQ